jgi:hypothetical protein
MRKAHISFAKPERKGPLGRPRRRLDGDIDLYNNGKEIAYARVDRIQLAQNRVQLQARVYSNP